MKTEIKTPRDHRTLVIKNFRNFAPFCAGTKDDKDEDKEFLILNRSLERDELGGLVELISANNCGKSNLLEALEKYNYQIFNEEDYTDFTFAKVKPNIGMNVANGAYGSLHRSRDVVTYEGRPAKVIMALCLEKESYDCYISYLNKLYKDCYYIKPGTKTKSNLGKEVLEMSVFNYIQNVFNSLKKPIYNSGTIITDGFFAEVLSRAGLEFSDRAILSGAIKTGTVGYDNGKTIKIVSRGTPIDDHFFASLTDKRTPETEMMVGINLGDYGYVRTINEIIEAVRGVDVRYSVISEIDDSGKSLFFEKFGYVLSDNVYRYERVRIRQEDLVCKPDAPNEFIQNIMAIIGYDKDAIVNAYSGAKNQRLRLEKLINKSLDELSDELNDLLNIDEKKYALQIKLERENIEFFITYGDEVPLNLDRQSEGFTWLFDLFFNLIKMKKFQPGDIILMDEFGNSLSFATIGQLTKQLRAYARKNGLTIVLATQNPMAIDNLHLDEVRLLVPRDDGSTHIVNNFDKFGEEGNHDVMGPILNGLTVSRNYMRSDNRRTVFVEGATDYFYLNAVSEVLRSKGKDIDVDFISMNGLGNKKNQKDVLNQILSIERSPIIFTDSDTAGLEFSKLAKTRNVEPSNITEILGDGKSEIEDAFSASDAEKLGVKIEGSDPNKKFDHALHVARVFASDYDSLDEETRVNFEKIIDYIMSQ